MWLFSWATVRETYFSRYIVQFSLYFISYKVEEKWFIFLCYVDCGWPSHETFFHCNCNFAYSDYWHAGSKRKTTNTNFRMVSRQVDLFRHMADCFTLRYDILQLSHIVYGIRRKWSPIILIIGRALIRGDGSVTNFDRLSTRVCVYRAFREEFFIRGWETSEGYESYQNDI